jgi:hypothetical protein
MADTFQDYLAKRRPSKTPAGDFVRELQDDPAMAQIESWPQLQAYIFRHAHSRKVKDIVGAAEPVWKGYRAHVLKSRRSK